MSGTGNEQLSSSTVSSALSYPSTSGKDIINKDGSPSEETNDLRLWIGNLDPKLTEFHLLKLVQRFGLIDNFDFLFHRSGPNAGLPRGYAFVTYKDTKDAAKCLQGLNGKKILEKYVVVRWAHQATQNFTDDEEKIKNRLPALGIKTEPETPLSKEKTISAIEAKLRAMEREKGSDNDNFNLAGPGLSRKGASMLSRNPGSSSIAGNNNQNFNANNARRTGYRQNRFNHSDKYRKPYERTHSRR